MLATFLAVILFNLPITGDLQDISAKYRKWLDEEVVYIISEKEREIFSRLDNNSQRERFIEEFWLERDPSPGSVKNEFREEHYRRIDFANEHFGKETNTEGWKTDRGRIYITLGEPGSRQRFPAGTRLHPAELWTFTSDYSQGLPPYFYCLFFKKNGLWDYILYNPGKHSPSDLINLSAGENPEQAPQIIAQLNMQLAKASISLLPSENVDIQSYNGTASLSSIQLLASINNIANFQRDYGYAERIYKGEGRVSTGYTFTAEKLPTNFHISKLESGYSLLNYAFRYPGGLKLGKYGSNMYLSLNVFFQVENDKGEIVVSKENKIEREISSSNAENIKDNGLIYQGVYILLPGEYNVSLTVSNNVSKKFFSVGDKISVRNYVAEKLQIDPPLLFDVSQKDPDVSLSHYPPYTHHDIRFKPLLASSIPQGQMLGIMYQLHDKKDEENTKVTYEVISSRGEVVNQHRIIVEDRNFDVNGTATVFWRLSTNDLPEGKYYIELIASSSDQESRVKSGSFRIARDTEPYDLITLESEPLNFLTPEPTLESITQLMQQEKYEAAERMIRNARKKWPEEEQLNKMFAQALMKNEKYLEAKNILRARIMAEPDDYETRFQLGLLLLRTGKYLESISELENVRNVEGDHPDILNPLGEAYQLSGDDRKAKEVWQISLEMDPSQELLKRRLEEM